ncbi:hypothetical protein B0H10DRAFT_1956080 [Mycena sp. CBHHK59/15]|nr:hypothetical protein B0H10DRAFT_1956080 [Mycena sp. CBHHK59/15]
MPENREGTSSGMVAQNGLSTAQAAGADLTLVQIVCDATEKEAEAVDASDRARQGLPYELDATSTVVRGSLNQQTPVYPPFLKPPSEPYPPTPYPATLKSLVLSGVESTHRALILHFGTLHLMVQYLTHTSVQCYSRERWEKSVMLVSKEVRKFHIGMALGQTNVRGLQRQISCRHCKNSR